MALSFAEIVNQLNALSCLHLDDDDDDDGVLKRARKACAKPAASSQGFLFTFLSSLSLSIVSRRALISSLQLSPLSPSLFLTPHFIS